MRNHAEIAGGHEMIVTHDCDGAVLDAPAEVALGPAPGRSPRGSSTTVTVVRRLRQAYQRAEDAAARVRDRLTCRRRGHLWDTDRPAGPIHKRDICWRCNAVREEKR